MIQDNSKDLHTLIHESIVIEIEVGYKRPAIFSYGIFIKGLEAEHVVVKDESDGCGGKFDALIVSNKFEGKVNINMTIIYYFRIIFCSTPTHTNF